MYNVAITACEQSRRWFQALQLLSHMLRFGPSPDIISFNAVIGALKKGEQWARALQIFGVIPEAGLTPTPRTFTTVIGACSRCGAGDQAIRLVRDMQDQRHEISQFVRTELVKVFQKAGDWQLALEQLSEVRAMSEHPDKFLLTAVVVSCGMARRWEEALRVLEEAALPDAGLYVAVARACEVAHQRQHAQAVRLRSQNRQQAGVLQRAKSGTVAARATVREAVEAHERSGSWAEALHAVAVMWQEGLDPGDAVIRAAAAACGTEEWERAIHLLEEARRRTNREPSVAVYDAVLGACLVAWRSALDLLTGLRSSGRSLSVITYSHAINACVEGGRRFEAKGGVSSKAWLRAVSLLIQAAEDGLQIDAAACNAALSACITVRRAKSSTAVAVGKWQPALQVLEGMVLRGPHPNIVSYSAAVRACAEATEWEQVVNLLASTTWRKMPQDSNWSSPKQSLADYSSAAYDAGMMAFEVAGRWELTLQVLSNMLSDKDAPRPSVVTCSAAVGVCARMSQWVWALHLFHDLHQSAGVEPDLVCCNA
ncbi:unnamed protein product, partial [Polarella glacialis]